MTIVKVATKNQVKIEAIMKAFERYFKEVKIIPYDVKSGVPSQPINEDVFKGAQNRIDNLKKVDSLQYDYLVSCEGGLVEEFGHWFNLQVVQIERNDGKTGIGLSQGCQIPHKYIKEIRSTSISKLFNRLFGKKGGISVLTCGQLNRKDLVENGTIMALTRFLNDAW